MTTNLKALREQYDRLGDEIKQLEKEEAAFIRLKKPKPGSREEFYACQGGGFGYPLAANNDYPDAYFGFCSTNKAQALAFRGVLEVMAELRTQPGIAVPNGITSLWGIKYTIEAGAIYTETSTDTGFQLLSPAFSEKRHAEAAIKAVGPAKIMDAFKTLLFRTSESRGEVVNA